MKHNPNSAYTHSILKSCGISSISSVAKIESDFELYTEGDNVYDAMITAINLAQSRVWLATYIFATDVVGLRIIEALKSRSTAGVDVRLSIDAFGSFLTFPKNVERELSRSGIKVRRCRRWKWNEPFNYNRRDHRKLLIVDDKDVFLGGFNIHRQSSRLASGETRWRDTHIRISGKLALEAAELFNFFWNGDLNWSPHHDKPVQSEILPNYSRQCCQRLHCNYSDVLNQARNYLYVTTPYFVPNRRLRKSLIAAAKHNVDVRVLLPRKSDVRLVQWAARAAYGNLMSKGIRIYEYIPRMLHAKSIIIDDMYSVIGSANMDYRSIFLNYELNLFSANPQLCLELKRQFYKDLEESEEIQLDKWRRRSWSSHILEWLGWKFRRWL